MDTSTWNWDVAAKTIGVQRDGRFNAGAVHLRSMYPLFSGFGSDAVRVRLEDSQTRLAVVDAPNRAALDDAEEALADLEVPTVDAGGGRDDHSLPALLERRALAVP
jgi:hypothetical protein